LGLAGYRKPTTVDFLGERRLRAHLSTSPNVVCFARIRHKP
jgi:hypothetical protein